MKRERRPVGGPIDGLAETERRLIEYYEAQLAGRARSRRIGRRLIWIGMALGAILLFVCNGLLPTLFGASSGPRGAPQNMSSCGADFEVDTSKVDVRGMSNDQLANAAVIVEVGKQMNVPPRGWVIAIATAMQESTLRNLGNLGARNDHDSLGLFQQRPSMGWGTPAQIMDPKYSSRKFYERLLGVAGWQDMRLTVAAQAVQRSKYPGAYQKWEPLATTVVNGLTNGGGYAVANVAGSDPRCAQTGDVTAAGWTQPAPGPVGSGFRAPGRPTHVGIDISSPRGTEIRASGAGIVVTAKCNVSVGTCDTDGGLNIKGCGWYVEISHGGGIMTRYCHMLRRPLVTVGQQVTAGQPLGVIGSSGNSTGAHLHFEVWVNGKPIDPAGFLRARGAPLGKT